MPSIFRPAYQSPAEQLWTNLVSFLRYGWEDDSGYAEEIVKRQNLRLINESTLFSLFHDAVKAIGPYELARRRHIDAPTCAPATARLSIRKGDVQFAVNDILLKFQQKKIDVVGCVNLVAKEARRLVDEAVTSWYRRFCTSCHQEFPAESLRTPSVISSPINEFGQNRLCPACWDKLAPRERSSIPMRADMPENLGRMRFVPSANTTTVTSIPIDHKRARRGT